MHIPAAWRASWPEVHPQYKHNTLNVSSGGLITADCSLENSIGLFDNVNIFTDKYVGSMAFHPRLNVQEKVSRAQAKQQQVKVCGVSFVWNAQTHAMLCV